MKTNDVIVALSTPPGHSAVAVIKLSGHGCIEMLDNLFSGGNLQSAPGYSCQYGLITKEGETLDDVIVTLFRGPKSYTGEDVAEISCHGSPYVIDQLLKLCMDSGARGAAPGEFTQRAYLNGRIDLSQAEAVADLIEADNAARHQLATSQLRGHYSDKINGLRDQLIHFASMLELENDFGEEDVEFADRTGMTRLLNETLVYIGDLMESFNYGNAIKKGIAVVIAGEPNAGKSTLLNILLGEDKAIVSDIAGTTRDYIEDRMTIEGVEFRFIDTAGLRETPDELEALGIERTRQQIERAQMVLLLVPADKPVEQIKAQYAYLQSSTEVDIFLLLNKSDQLEANALQQKMEQLQDLETAAMLPISALEGNGLEALKKALIVQVKDSGQEYDLVLSNARHYQAFKQAAMELDKVRYGLEEGMPTDLIASDLRFAIHHISEITGAIDTEDLLDKIFRDFCIGK